jgi:hypothetical protein
VNCEQIRETLDAYAVGAAAPTEAKAVEEHVAGCIGCWDELKKSQRAAGLLALSSSIQPPPPRLGERLMTAAGVGERRRLSLSGLFSGRSAGWPAAAGAFGLAGAAALVFAVFLQAQVDDLQQDRDLLRSEVTNQGSIIGVATASDVRTVSMVSTASDTQPAATGASEPWGEYLWSRSHGKGVIFCHNLPDLPEGEVYQAWYATETEPVAAGTFTPEDGGCHHLMQPIVADISATGVGLSREKSGGSQRPTGRWLIFAPFD